jgi:hypothetical protein
VDDFASENDLLLKTTRIFGVSGYFRSNDFERYTRVLKEVILYLIDLAHTAASDKANDNKPIRDNLGRPKTGRDC